MYAFKYEGEMEAQNLNKGLLIGKQCVEFSETKVHSAHTLVAN